MYTRFISLLFLIFISFCLSASSVDTTITPIVTEIDTILCMGFGFEGYHEPGTYVDTFAVNPSCDSIRILHLDFFEENEVTMDVFCDPNYDPDISIFYQQVFQDQNGCDSIVQYEVVSGIESDLVQIYTFCEGEIFVTDEGLIIESTGLYTVDTSNQGPCESTLTYNVTFLPIGTVEDTICANNQYSEGTYNLPGTSCSDSLILTVLPVPDDILSQIHFCEGDSISWYDEKIQESGVYDTLYTAANGCTYKEELEVIFLPVEDCISEVSELYEQPLFQLYPNPTYSNLRITLGNNSLNNIYIYSSAGKLVRQYETHEYALDILVQDLSSGQYVVMVINEKGESQTLKFIKQKS